MIRYGYLPSDFHPQFLILGDRQEIIGLMEEILDFSENGKCRTIENAAQMATRNGAVLTLLSSDLSEGLVKTNAGNEFEWRLDRDHACIFVSMIEEMIKTNLPSGSVFLELNHDTGIPVKVSFGEYTETFLLDDF